MSDDQPIDSRMPSGTDWGGSEPVAGRAPARLVLVGQRLTIWLLALAALAVLVVHITDRWSTNVDALDIWAHPVLFVVFTSLAMATWRQPQHVAAWQRIAAVTLCVYFAFIPTSWVLPGAPVPSAAAVAGLAPWLLTGVLAAYIAWPPRIALAMGVVLSAAVPGPLAIQFLLDPSAATRALGWAWPLLIRAAVANAVFAATLFVLALEIQRLLRHLAPSMDQSMRWITVDDIAQRRIEAMDSARRLAQEASSAKSAFLANMSHEIRTPMNGVLGMTDLLARTRLDDQQQHFVRTIQRSGRMMMSLLNDILDLSKIEAGRVELQERPFVLKSVLEASMTLIEAAARKKALAVNLQMEPDLPDRVTGDRVKLQQVMNNLLSNAVKFTERGSITVSVSPEPLLGPAGCRVIIQDTGVGIPLTKQSAVFEPFVQVDASARRRHGGTGLGLAIVRRLVQAMGGEIGVQSQPRRGSRFWFTVRFGVVADEVIGGTGWKDSAFDHPREATPAVDQHPKDFLLVDDNEVNLLYGGEVLRQLGHRVQFARDGLEAVAAALRQRHDVILMDCQLPGMDGLEATRRIRQFEAQSGQDYRVIIAVTASALSEDRARCHRAGMDDLIGKPYTPEQLQEILQRHVRN